LKLGSSVRKDDISCQSEILALAYGWADAVGIRFAQVFRSAFVTNFVLASFAVIVAATSLLFAHEKKHLFVSIELGLIAVVLANTIVGRWQAWHQRWFEPREVAERLRTALALWTLGTRPTSFLGQEPAWTGWYARAIVREQYLRSGALDENGLSAARAVLLALLADQCGYHHTSAVRMRKLERRLEKFGLLLFGATVLTAMIFLLVARLAEVPEAGAFLITALAAGLPTLATASYGIRIIGDFEGIARRSERTHEALKQLIEAVNHDPLTLDRLRARARGASEAMLGDISSWRIAAESRSLNIPG
jgi:glycosyltransferase involved in cell wall biosynthesis